ncbi:MAG: hypothetical protein KBD62_35265 [Kofleriaceae bacterium]|nr:hypothetical protein [Kofleriaceae bacterium]
MRRVLVALLAAVLVVSVSSLAWKRRALERQIESDADESDRYVDMGVLLSVVEMDLANGLELEPGKPPVRIVRQHRLGGMLDTWTRQIVGPSVRPRYWQCSPQQEPIILHGDAAPLWTLVQGSEGAGKTAIIPKWTYCRILEHCGHGREMWITAPVYARLAWIKKAIADDWDPKWYRWKERDQTYRLRTGMTVRLLSAHQQSEQAGSPFQGGNIVACASDELQDHHEREPDIQARGRAAPQGKFKRLATSTFKDSTEWRNFRDTAARSPDWQIVKLLGLDSPFVWPKHWQRMRENGITHREYQRRVLAMDVGPEAQLYHCWSRSVDGAPGNLRPIPLGAIDVTAEVLAPYLPNCGVLIGHDPGTRQHVSMFLKAYRFRGDRHVRWFVVDEITTPDATIERHVADVIARTRAQWGCNMLDRKGRPDPEAPVALVRIDPHTRSGDAHPGQDVYTIWRKAGFTARAAGYKPGSTDPQQIKRTSRFDMMNTLLCDVNGVRRLFIACDDTGAAAAPKLVKAFESMEKNAEGKGEHEKKDADDLSHWPAAVGYALWQVERPRMEAVA